MQKISQLQVYTSIRKPVAPAPCVFKDRRKEKNRRACRGRVAW